MAQHFYEHRKAVIKEIVSWLLWLAGAFFIAQVLNQKIIVNAEVVSGSMETTIMTHDRVLGLRLAYTFGEPQRGDVVVFRNPYYDQKMAENAARAKPLPNYEPEPYIKRIIGMPGDTIAVRDDKAYINGQPLDESSYLTADLIAYLDYDHQQKGPDYAETLIPDGCYFMMGDCRNRSQDSRAWGFMPREDIIGRAYIDIFPFSHFKSFGHPDY